MSESTPVLQDFDLASFSVAGSQVFSEQPSYERQREFDNILSRSLPGFRRFAMRWLRNAEDAEDAVQEAMLSAFRNIARFDGRSRMSTWVTSIVINAVRMRLRSRSRSRTVSLDEAQDGTERVLADLIVDSARTPEQILEERELRALVVKLTACLSPCQRGALRLCEQEGRTVREAASILGVAEGTVKSQLARGRAKLAERCRRVLGLDKARISRPDPKARGEVLSSTYRDETPVAPYATITALTQQGGCESWAGA
jgi:RNA polymerase sigma-70 factor (ECF subfamily)